MSQHDKSYPNYYLYPTRLSHMPTTTKKNNKSTGLANHTKGIELEDMFCEFMKTELGYHKARPRAQVLSDSNDRGTNVDVIARLENKRLRYVKWCFYVLMTLAVSYSVLSIYLAEENDLQNATYLFYFSVIILFFGIWAIIFYEKNNIEHGWAECKNQKEAISTELMQIAEMRLNSYKKTKDKEYNFTKLYFVSANEFSEGALKFAQDKNIICYKLDCGNFVEVTYWGD